VSLGSSQQRALATEMAAWVKDSSATPRSVDAYLRNLATTVSVLPRSGFDEPDVRSATIAT
jgi:hypothetical protein